MNHAPGVVEAAVSVLKVMDVLWDHMALGLATSEAAKAAQTTTTQATRALQTLQAAGYVEKIPETGRWRPSVRVARLAVAVHRSIDRQEARTKELRARVGGLV